MVVAVIGQKKTGVKLTKWSDNLSSNHQSVIREIRNALVLFNFYCAQGTQTLI